MDHITISIKPYIKIHLELQREITLIELGGYNNSITSPYNGQKLQLLGHEGETTIHNDHRNIKNRIAALEQTATTATGSYNRGETTIHNHRNIINSIATF